MKKDPDDLSTENELMKLKMMAEFGGDFMGSDEIPPEIENLFLKQIRSFHKKHNKAQLTTVYKYIGQPEYNHVNDLSAKEIEKELTRLLKIMAKKGVGLAALSDTPPRELYRFIVEELFKKEIEDVKMKGWVNQFIYEDFYPNPDYDVKSAAQSCIQAMFDFENVIFPDLFSEEMKDHIGLSIDSEDVFAKVQEFKQQFTQLKLQKINIVQYDLDKEAGTANLIANVSYNTQVQKGKRLKLELTQIELNLVRDEKIGMWWLVNQVICDLF